MKIIEANRRRILTTFAPKGQAEYTTPGTYSWTCPAGVTSVCAVAIGGGGGGIRYTSGTYQMHGGAGGGLGWKNNITVIPGAASRAAAAAIILFAITLVFTGLQVVVGKKRVHY